MDNHCKLCNQPRKPRYDRPGKFFTLCAEHYAGYQRQKNRESYARHREARVERSRKYREENPDKVKESLEKYWSKEKNRERHRKYMRTYLRPWREHVTDTCAHCGFVSEEEDLRDMDVHHIDENKQNNDPSNLETLCARCHRQVRHIPGRTKGQQRSGELADVGG